LRSWAQSQIFSLCIFSLLLFGMRIVLRTLCVCGVWYAPSSIVPLLENLSVRVEKIHHIDLKKITLGYSLIGIIGKNKKEVGKFTSQIFTRSKINKEERYTRYSAKRTKGRFRYSAKGTKGESSTLTIRNPKLALKGPKGNRHRYWRNQYIS